MRVLAHTAEGVALPRLGHRYTSFERDPPDDRLSPASSRRSTASKYLRHLTVAFALAATASALSTTLAGAASVDPGVRCAAQTGPGSYDFYLPGERAVDKDGNKWVCGPDGKWLRDYSSLQGKTAHAFGLTKRYLSFVIPPTAVVAKP